MFQEIRPGHVETARVSLKLIGRYRPIAEQVLRRQVALCDELVEGENAVLAGEITCEQHHPNAASPDSKSV